jgi:membrane-associated protease RseP (regulator of RpoE activity)
VIRRSITVLAVLVLVASVAAARPGLVPPSAAELKATAEALTGPGMDGRRSSTPGGDLAARQLADWLRAAGLRPGGEGESFFQSFVVASGARIAAGTTLRALDAGGPTFETGRDWTPHGGSLRDSVSGEVVFVGYGVSAPQAGYDDWAGVEARGRIALALEGAPPHLAGLGATRLEKLIAARRAGASGVLLVADRLPPLDATATVVRIVSGALTPAAADAVLAPTGATIAGLARTIAERRAPVPVVGGARMELRVALQSADRTAVNVLGVLPGRNPARAGEAIVIGAHYDHLGVVGGAIYPGADDNASGTAVVVGLARAFAAAGPLERPLVFALFGAEEIGLVGSGHYVRRPAVSIDRTVAMLNFDMVGRLGEARLTVGGVASGRGLRDVVADAAAALAVGVTLRGSPFGPSDHSRFYDAGAPVLFFHTGLHADYHRPGDTPDKLDTAGMARVAALGARVAERLAAADRPAYVALARPPAQPSEPHEAGAAAPVFLGVGTDGRAEADGLRLTHVVPASAAARAGLQEGDVLVRFGDRGVESFEDLRAALRTRRRGDVVQVLYLRDGLEHDTAATLDARP